MKATHNPMPGQVLRRSDLKGGSGDKETGGVAEQASSLADANLITSECGSGINLHKVVLDVDMPVRVEPSTTPGHHHLYIDKMMPWSDYKKLMTVMGEVGILEPGYVGASIARGYSAVRLPGIRKEMTPEVVHNGSTKPDEGKSLPWYDSDGNSPDALWDGLMSSPAKDDDDSFELIIDER